MSDIYVDKSTGEKVTILNEDINFYVLSNSVRIKKDVFQKRYDKKNEIDPSSFFSAPPSADPLVAMANQLKNMDTSKLQDNNESGTRIKYIEKPKVISDSSLPPGAKIKQPQVEEEIQLSSSEKQALLDDWKRKNPDVHFPQKENVDWDKSEEELLSDNEMKNESASTERKTVVKKEEKVIDPISMMFKMFKNNYPVKLKLEIEDNIPNPVFIGMVQENVEADAVEYYSKIISEKILKDPNKLKSQIYEQLKGIIDNELGTDDKEKKDKE
jgi:hypothetical protein